MKLISVWGAWEDYQIPSNVELCCPHEERWKSKESKSRQRKSRREKVNISVVIRFCMPALIFSCLAAGSLATLSALVNVTPHTCQCDSTQPIFTSWNGSVHHHGSSLQRLLNLMREDLDVKSSFEEEDTIPHLHLPNKEMHYADLKITDNRKHLYERKTRLAVSQGF